MTVDMIRRILVLTGAAAALLVARASVADEPVAAMRLDAELARDLGGHCRYAVAIHGTTTRLRGSLAVEPNIHVRALLECPDGGAVSIDDTAMSTGPLTKEQLVHALERRATLVTARPAGRCVYVPELALTGVDLQLRSVSIACR